MARTEKYILFYLGEDSYALPALYAKKFVEFKHLLHLPNVSKEIKGLLYHNGNIITVIDTKVILSVKPLQKPSQKICLIFESNNYYYGLLVHQGGDTVVAKKIFTDKQKKIFQRYFKTPDQKKVYILEIDKILSQININD